VLLLIINALSYLHYRYCTINYSPLEGVVLLRLWLRCHAADCQMLVGESFVGFPVAVRLHFWGAGRTKVPFCKECHGLRFHGISFVTGCLHHNTDKYARSVEAAGVICNVQAGQGAFEPQGSQMICYTPEVHCSGRIPISYGGSKRCAGRQGSRRRTPWWLPVHFKGKNTVVGNMADGWLEVMQCSELVSSPVGPEGWLLLNSGHTGVYRSALTPHMSFRRHKKIGDA
jgi:hypothetical protein